ncbi:chloramphenicol acetyltransferase [Flavobacterium sp. SM15]|uniref:chloramphenicol acetyltransferase n=1 Tax=Flavobacterium sp. SM15 TaxID=2908005 RepID=UPI001EDB4625|nr:chloramphenicol acetyltransferase [Flavobacterium sp. SM15]MCG2611853.1 chloramphenicol acetyltransferase [Flavobacterium sp. SM15]
MRIIDVESWNRKEHFEFFTKMDSPYFGIVTEVECTHAYTKAKELKQSFFATYMHKSMMAVNQTEEFKYRIVDNQVVVFDVIHAGTTIGREDGTFGFAFIPFSEDFKTFNAELQREIQEVQNSTGLRLNNDDLKSDLIRHSTLPWSSFTGLLHPTNFKNNESVPKITFGKAFIREGKRFLPVSVEANHGLVDGLHIARYLEKFQHFMNAL